MLKYFNILLETTEMYFPAIFTCLSNWFAHMQNIQNITGASPLWQNSQFALFEYSIFQMFSIFFDQWNLKYTIRHINNSAS